MALPFDSWSFFPLKKRVEGFAEEVTHPEMTSHFHSLLIPFPLWALAPQKEGCVLAGAEEEKSVMATSEESGRGAGSRRGACIPCWPSMHAR
jgi:hypothetical protein